MQGQKKLKYLSLQLMIYSDIGIEFGLEKCCKCSARRGKKVEADIKINEGTIHNLAEDWPFKYLGIIENTTFEHKEMREK